MKKKPERQSASDGVESSKTMTIMDTASDDQSRRTKVAAAATQPLSTVATPLSTLVMTKMAGKIKISLKLSYLTTI